MRMAVIGDKPFYSPLKGYRQIVETNLFTRKLDSFSKI